MRTRDGRKWLVALVVTAENWQCCWQNEAGGLESLPLRQHFNFRLLNIAFHQLWLRPHEILLDAIRAPRVRLASASLALE